MPRLRLVPVVVALALAVAACGSSKSSSSSSASSSSSSTGASSSASASTSSTTTTATGTSAPAASGVQVTMRGLAFQPAVIHAKVGQTVVWTNDDTPAHNVTYVSGPKFTSSPTIKPGQKFQLKLTQAGTIHYFCTIHPFMKGTIVVSP
jgi:amicyanin